jgi:hypothetical protein
MTLAPLLARSLAASRPMPALAPVTTTTCIDHNEYLKRKKSIG